MWTTEDVEHMAYHSSRFNEEQRELMGKLQQSWMLESTIEATIMQSKLGYDK